MCLSNVGSPAPLLICDDRAHFTKYDVQMLKENKVIITGKRNSNVVGLYHSGCLRIKSLHRPEKAFAWKIITMQRLVAQPNQPSFNLLD